MNYRRTIAALLFGTIAFIATGCANWQIVRIQVYNEVTGVPVEGASVETRMGGAVLRPGLLKYPNIQHAITDRDGMCVAVLDVGLHNVLYV